MVNIKINHCADVVSPRDIMVMEMLEWSNLIEQRSKIDSKLHNCLFNAVLMDSWEHGVPINKLITLNKEK